MAHDALFWAFAGRDAFISKLQVEEFKRLYSERITGEPVVLVYGGSQVGKTELILRLIGLDLTSPHLHSVKNALRGGRPEGKSASATATVYRRGEGEHFSLARGDRQWGPLTIAGLRQHVAEVRNEVEAGRWRADGPPLEITLPSAIMGPSLLAGAHVTILDLPGVGSDTPAEYAHVSALLARYLPIASVVVLVYQAMQLARLGTIEAPELADWREELPRFRLVLTRAVSPDDVQRAAKANPDWDFESLRRHYRSELLRTVDGFPTSFELFPVEYGESWQTFSGREPELHRAFAPHVDAELRRLGSQIPEATPELALQAMIRAHTQLETRRTRKLATLAESLSAAEQSFAQAQEDVRVLDHLLDAAQTSAARLATARVDILPPRLDIPDLLDLESQTTTEFKAFLNACEAAIVDGDLAYRGGLQAALAGWSPERSDAWSIVNGEFRAIRAKLASYTYPNYDPFFVDYSSDQLADRVSCRESALRARERVVESMKIAFASAVTVASARLDAARDTVNAQHRERLAALKAAKRVAGTVEHRVDSCRRERGRYERSSLADVETARGLRSELLLALDRDTTARVQKVRDPHFAPEVRLQTALSVLAATARARSLDLFSVETP